MTSPGSDSGSTPARTSCAETSSAAAVRPPFAYYGGKTKLAAAIVGTFDDHDHYVEPYAGSMAVLLAKPRSRMETVNDLDGALVGFWKVLRERPHELARVCALTPHSRAEWQSCADLDPVDLVGEDALLDVELERARRVWVRLTQGRAGRLQRTGWRHYVDPGAASTGFPAYLDGYVDRIAAAAERLHHVSLECRPALELIERYGAHRRVLLYLDPPYLGSVRAQDRSYRHELLGDDEHRELAAALHACQATVVLSGYPSALYDQELYPGWYRHSFRTGTGQSQDGTGWTNRTEVLWSNRPLRAPTDPDGADGADGADGEQYGLFDPAPGEGADPADAFRYTSDVDPAGSNGTRCAATDCRKVIRQPATGRRRDYCSTACRVRTHRRTRRVRRDPSIETRNSW